MEDGEGSVPVLTSYEGTIMNCGNEENCIRVPLDCDDSKCVK